MRIDGGYFWHKRDRPIGRDCFMWYFPFKRDYFNFPFKGEGTVLCGAFPLRDYFNFPFKGEGTVLCGAFPLRDYGGLIGDRRGTKNGTPCIRTNEKGLTL